MDGDVDEVRKTRERLIDAVVDELDDEVLQAAEIGGADVHPGPTADRFEALEDLDLVGRVRILRSPPEGGGMRTRVAVSGARSGLDRHLVGAFGACSVGYRWCSGGDVSVGNGAIGETARLSSGDRSNRPFQMCLFYQPDGRFRSFDEVRCTSINGVKHTVRAKSAASRPAVHERA